MPNFLGLRSLTFIIVNLQSETKLEVDAHPQSLASELKDSEVVFVFRAAKIGPLLGKP